MFSTLRIARRANRALTTQSVARAPLAPPYAHALTLRPSPALAPPYAHQSDAHSDSESQSSHSATSLRPPYAYTLPKAVTQTSPATDPRDWVAKTLATDRGRDWAIAAWDSTLAALANDAARAEVEGGGVPSIPFQALSERLSSAALRAEIARTGAVIVRDVVRDSTALVWSRELLQAQAERAGQTTFYHPAQLAARADTSLLSATGQVFRSLVPPSAPGGLANPGCYVRVDATCAALTPAWTPASTTADAVGAIDSLWDVDTGSAAAAAAPTSPVHAHLALAPANMSIASSTVSALYSLLRPFFSPLRSRISFYDAAGYLDTANWVFTGTLPAPVSSVSGSIDLPHILPVSISLAPGDLLLTHAGLPGLPNSASVSTTSASASASPSLHLLPVHPLPATEANKSFVSAQREAFEAGLPPPHVVADGPVAVEEPGESGWIESWGGRRAMGYGW